MSTEKFRILAVDDENDILDLVNITLTPKYEVLTVGDPTTVIDALEIFEPELVILDIMMPKVTGYHIIEDMKKNPRYQNIPVLFLSAKDTSRDIKLGYKLGASVYLPKPFQPDRLLRNVETLLAKMKLHPRTFSMRDVLMRMQLKQTVGLTGSPEAMREAADRDTNPTPQGMSRLKRQLGQEHQEQEKKKWIG